MTDIQRGRYGLMIVWAAGLSAAVLRAVQLKDAWDLDLMLMDDGVPFTQLLIGFVLAFVVCAALVFYRMKRGGRFDGDAVCAEAPVHRPGRVLSGFAAVALLLFSGVADIFELTAEFSWSLCVFVLLTFLAAWAVAVTLRDASRPRLARGVRAVYLLGPVFWATYWLVLTFRENPTLPVTSLYLFDSLTIAFFMLATLYRAGTGLDRYRPGRTRFFAVMGLFFSLLSVVSQCLYHLWAGRWLGEPPAVGHFLRLIFVAVYLSIMLYGLLARSADERRQPDETPVAPEEPSGA